MVQLSSSSNRWLQRQKRDHYVHDAKKKGYRARSAFKLIEISERFHIFRSVRSVVDLGSAPGGWSQVVRRFAHPQAQIFAVDRVAMESIDGVHFKQGDITDPAFSMDRQGLFDLVLSDMAPNLTGVRVTDQVRACDLILAASDFCKIHLKTGGNFLVKAFQGRDLPLVEATLREGFRRVVFVKPKASRADSSELYLWCSDRC